MDLRTEIISIPSTNVLFVIIGTVYCAVRTESLNIIEVKSYVLNIPKVKQIPTASVCNSPRLFPS